MSEKKHKRTLSTSSKYQEQIIFLAILPSFFAIISFLGLFVYGFLKIREDHILNSPIIWENLVLHSTVWIVVTLCIILILTFICAFIISRDMVGAFNRILHEMDEIIAKRSDKKHITARPKDELANALLKRINVFLKGYQGE